MLSPFKQLANYSADGSATGAGASVAEKDSYDCRQVEELIWEAAAF